eukprot:GEMP01012787.1.p1 GENE.GEMP01012787.1~~GEMP01012787.1.p1  ORF type:complete len:789 (+),score=161.17 GEMP01012787.1:182-2548(+)
MDCVAARISATEVKHTLGGLQTHTTYKIEVIDFGHSVIVERRYDDFNNLHSELARICGESNLPEMPKKLFFGSMDAETVEKRRPQLELLIQWMLKSSEALLERQNLLWNFLDLPLGAICCVRFLQVEPGMRGAYVRQLVKIVSDDKFAADRYRIAYPAVMRELLNMFDSPVLDMEIETAVMEILKAVLKQDAKARQAFLDLRGMHRLFTVAAKRETSLELSRGVFNGLIMASGPEFPQTFCDFLESGLPLLRELCTNESDEYFWPFLAKIIWISWEPVTIRAFITPHGLPLLSTLFQSKSVVGRAYVACLLATALVHGAFEESAMQRAAEGIDGFVIEMLTSPPPLAQLSGLETLTRAKSSFQRLLPCLNCSETTARLALWIMARVSPKDGFLTPDLFRGIKRWTQSTHDVSTRMLTAKVLLHIGAKGDPNGPTPWFADIESFNATRTFMGEFLSTEVARMVKSHCLAVEKYNIQKSRDTRAAPIPSLEEQFSTFKSTLDSYQTSRFKIAEALSLSENLLKKYDSGVKTSKHNLDTILAKKGIPLLEDQMNEFQLVDLPFEEQHNVEKRAVAEVEEAARAKAEADMNVKKGEEKLAKLREEIRHAEEKRSKLLQEIQALRVKEEDQKMAHGRADVGAIEKQIAEKEAFEQKIVAQRQKWREQEQAVEKTTSELRKTWVSMSEVQVQANSRLHICQARLEEIAKRKRDQQGIIEEKVRPAYNQFMGCELNIQKCEDQTEQVSALLDTNWALFRAEKEERTSFLETLRNLKEVISSFETSLLQMDDSELA